MRNVLAILPLKAFERAKARLSPVLSVAERATLARLMARDALQALSAVTEIGRVLIAGQDAEHAVLAAEFGFDYVEDDPAVDVSRNVARAAGLAGAADADALFYMAADLPSVTSDDVRALLALHRYGMTIGRALRDGGSNALVASPPGAVAFSFGSNSSERHAAAARTAGWPVRMLDLEAFQRDIDEPADLFWFCRHGRAGAALAYVTHAGFASRLHPLVRQAMPVAT